LQIIIKMYAVVEYDDYRKEQSFTVIFATNNLEEAKVIAFKKAKQNLINYDLKEPDFVYKLTTNVKTDYFRPTNEIIISYRVVILSQQEKRLLLKSSSTNVVAVIKMNNNDNDQLLQNNDEDDYDLFICDNYITDIADDVSYEDNSNDEYWSYDDNDNL